jgi:hypothetical protein
MRLPYIPNPPLQETAEEVATVLRIEARRAPSPLLEIDLTLLYSRPVADGLARFLLRNPRTYDATA